MRGPDDTQESLFAIVNLDGFVPADHPLRPIRPLVNAALKQLDGTFASLYATRGRASIAPEKLMRALLIQIFYSIRSERMLVEQIGYNMLFRWFVGLAIDDPVWDHSVFSKNRNRLISQDAVTRFFPEVLAAADRQGLLAFEEFVIDKTLPDMWSVAALRAPLPPEPA